MRRREGGRKGGREGGREGVCLFITALSKNPTVPSFPSSLLPLPFSLPPSFLAVIPTGFIAKLARMPLLTQPGTEWRYSVGFDVLGR